MATRPTLMQMTMTWSCPERPSDRNACVQVQQHQ
jgi:hypothetical protein